VSDVVERAAQALLQAQKQIRADVDSHISVSTGLAIRELVGVIPDLIEEIARLREVEHLTTLPTQKEQSHCDCCGRRAVTFHTGDDGESWICGGCRDALMAAAAASPTQQDKVTTLDQLDALPVGVVVKFGDGIYEKDARGTWFGEPDDGEALLAEVDQATVLWTPAAVVSPTQKEQP